MRRALLLAVVNLLFGSLFFAGCATAPESVRGKLPFRVKVIPPSIDQGDGEVPIPQSLVQNITDTVERALEDIFVEVVPVDKDADLAVYTTIGGKDFGEGTVHAGYAALSTILWLAAGHLSWFIEDREYADSDVGLIMRFQTVEGAEKEVYFVEVRSRGLKLNNMERSNAGNAFLNIFVPPFFIKGDRDDVARGLTNRLLKKFAMEETARISSRLPRRYLAQLSCFLVHQGDMVIVVSQDRVMRLKIGESRELGLDEIARYEVVDKEHVKRISDEISDGLSGLVVPGEPVFFYEVPLQETGTIPIRATLPHNNTARWTIFHERRVTSPGS